MPNTNDPWKLDSGLRDDAVFTIVSAYFGTTAQYQDGTVTLLTLVGYDENGTEMTEKLSVGGDWITNDGGKTIVHPTKTRIVKNSIYGHWLQKCIDIPELYATLQQRGEPRHADIWNTLIIHVTQQEISFGKKLEPISRLLPLEYLGVADPSGDQSSPQPSPVVPTYQSLTPGLSSATMSPADAIAAARAARGTASVDPRMAALRVMALSSSSHEEFMAQAFATDDVLADDDMATQVADPNGIYAQAKENK